MKIRILDVKYFTNGTSTVVCKVSVGTGNLVEKTGIRDFVVNTEGKAKVSGEDTFNLETGKHIAFSRAKIKAMQEIRNTLVEYRNIGQKVLDYTTEAIDKVNNAISGEKSRVSKTIESLVTEG